MKVNTGLASHAYKTVAAAFLVVLLLIGFSLVPPAFAQSEDSTCQGSCCESSDMQCCSGGAMGCCQSPGQTQPTGTAFHHAIVNVVDGEILLQIEPLSPPETGCESCAGNQGCPSGGKPTNVQLTVLEQDENHTVILLTYEVNGTTFEVTIARTLLWRYNEVTNEINRTANFVSTEITAEDRSMQFYSLSYMVQHAEYNLTLYTNLVPLDSETYNSSFTVMSYAPAGNSALTSLEFVEFNSSVTLSQQYEILGKVAKEVGKLYEKSGNETLAGLAQSYYTMKEEAKYLSKLVEKQLAEYNMETLYNSAVLIDDFWSCLFCSIGCEAGAWAACAACCVATYVCCVCIEWLEIFPIYVACHMICEAWGYCP